MVLDMKGVFDGALAADPGTVGVFIVSGADALDHDHLIQIRCALGFQALASSTWVMTRRILAVEIFLGLVFLAPVARMTTP